MKKTFYILFVFGLLISCKEEKKEDFYSNEEIVSTQKYQTEVFQGNTADYYLVTLNRMTGKVFIGKNGTGWYEATNAEEKSVYNTPTYSIRLFKTIDSSFQIALSDGFSGDINIYIVGHTASFYNTNIPLEKLDKD
jgi:hypothetical protein